MGCGRGEQNQRAFLMSLDSVKEKGLSSLIISSNKETVNKLVLKGDGHVF